MGEVRGGRRKRGEMGRSLGRGAAFLKIREEVLMKESNLNHPEMHFPGHGGHLKLTTPLIGLTR